MKGYFFIRMRTIFIFFIFISSSVLATEPRISMEEALRQGFSPFKFSNQQSFHIATKAHALSWPFEAPYRHGFMGNNYVQYQPYTRTGGYHMGCDMVLDRDSWLIAPMDGKLEAGSYTYTDLPDGTSIKHWKPWPQGGGAYFEVAVIDSAGFRHEYHHVDRDSLPAEIESRLNQGNAVVKKGEKLGRVFRWNTTSFHYDHIHVNVYSPEGKQINPEWFYEVLPDDRAPDVKALVEYKDGRTAWAQGIHTKSINQFIIIGADQKNNNIFSQAPIKIVVKFDQGGVSTLDFRQTVRNEGGAVNDIRSVFPRKITMPDFTTRSQMQDYFPNDPIFYMAIPSPTDRGNGAFTIEVSDMKGNVTEITGVLTL